MRVSRWLKVALPATALVTLAVVPPVQAAPKIVLKVVDEQYGPPPYYWNQWLEMAAKQFERTHPNVQVKLIPIVAPEGEYYTKLDLMQSSPSTAPDVVVEDSFLISSDVSAGYLRPITAEVNAWPQYQQYYPAMKQIVTFNHQIYGVMFGTDVRALWYNTAVFKKAGLPIPWHPTNWAQVIQAAQTIKKKVPGVIPFSMYSGIPNDEASTMQGFEMLLYGTGNSLYDYHSGKWIVKSPGFLKALEFVQQAFKQGWAESIPDALSTQWSTEIVDNLFPANKLGIDLDGFWISSAWGPHGSHPWPAWQKVMAWTPMPTDNGQPPHYVTLSGGWALSISAKSQHPSLAWQFIETACDRYDTAWVDAHVVNIAPRADVAASPIYHAIPTMSAFSKLLPYTYFRPAFPAYPKISYYIDQAMEEVMTGQMSPAAAMSQYAQEVTALVGASHTEVLNGPETAAQLRP